MNVPALAQTAVAACRVPAALRDDALQEAAEAILKSQQSYSAEHSTTVDTWAITKAKWAIRDYLAREWQHRQQHSSVDETHAPAIPDPSCWVAEFDHIVTTLNHEDLQFILAYAFGMPMKTLSARYRLNGKGVKTRVWEVQQLLRTH